MNENTNTAEPKRFVTMDGNTLMVQEYEPLQFSIDKILPHGLFIMAGSGKIGKSWLSLAIGVTVAAGGKLWGFSAEQGTALYLALEDNYPRLKYRLEKIQAENIDISRLHLTTAAFGLSNGLIEQANNFVTEYPDTKLIIIDTLERIRDTENDKSIYSCDYRDMTLLREITNTYKLTLLLIHHTRKLSDPDPLNTLSGSMELVGSTDGVFVFEKETRTGSKAKLTIANRDTEGFCFKIELDPETCKWRFLSNYDDAEVGGGTVKKDKDEKDEWLLMLVEDFLKDDWSGTATELSDALKGIDPDCEISPLNIKTKLINNETLFKNKSIEVSFDRESGSGKKLIFLKRRGE